MNRLHVLFTVLMFCSLAFFGNLLMGSKVTADTLVYGAFGDNASIADIRTTYFTSDNASVVDLNVQKLRILTTFKPTCDATVEGMLWYSGHSVGVKDDFQICAADGANAYAWRVIY